jgi:hypothetical protein
MEQSKLQFCQELNVGLIRNFSVSKHIRLLPPFQIIPRSFALVDIKLNKVLPINIIYVFAKEGAY